MIWRPIRSVGLSAAPGSCGTYDDRRAAQRAQLVGPSRSTSWPAITTRPAATRTPRRAWPSSASPTVVLPEPDSPTSPSTSPGRIRTRPRRRRRRRSRHVDPQVLDDTANSLSGARRAISRVAPSTPRDRARRARRRSGRSPIVRIAIASTGSTTPHGCLLDAELVLVDHQAPVGRRRLQAEAEEREAGDQPDRVRVAQRDLDQQRAQDVRQDLAEQDARRATRRSPASRARSRARRSRATSRARRAPSRGIVVSPIVITSSGRLGPTVAAATRVSTICGKQRMTSIVRISRSSTRPRA